MDLPPLRYSPPRPPLLPFALAFDHPRPSLDGIGAGNIGWQGIGPLGVPLLVRGDGIVIFDFPQAESFSSPAIPGYQPSYESNTPEAVTRAEAEQLTISYARLQYMNGWIAAYMAGMVAVAHHGIIVPAPVDPWQHWKAIEEHGIWHAFDNEQQLVQDRTDLTVVSPAVFDYALNVMSKAHAKLGNNFVTSLALLHQVSYQYRIHQFASAHIAGWSLAEQVLTILWEQYQIEVSTGPAAVTSISNKRRSLLNGRDYSASIITQILSLAGKISDERLEKLDQARRSRNAFAHALRPITGADAQNALTTATDMLSDILGLRLFPNLSNTFWI